MKDRIKKASTMGLALLAFSGCARPAQVESKQLPVQRVVVYRNGVAYFERSGEVATEQVHFQLRQENVGDFLATLAVMERGGHGVRAASFPVSMDEDEDRSEDPELQRALDSWDRKKRDPRSLRRVTLELDGEKHSLTVGYLAETPLWRPSYRLVVSDGGTAILQAWGIVQNQSGEDWKDVEISLVAGAPIAFQSTLGDPVIPLRPLVTDSGEVISRVPESMTTYHSMSAEAEADSDDVDEQGSPRDEGSQESVRSRMPAAAKASAPGGESNAGFGYSFREDVLEEAAPAPAPMISAPKDPTRLARVQVQTGATRYDVPHRVTIFDKSATMVLLLSKTVPGQAVYLFAPDGGVADSFNHPFRVARFKNESGGLLERGPIAVFEDGAFLGQGMVDSLPSRASATVPFALMRSISIRSEVSHDQRGARLYSVSSGQLTIERDQATVTAYHLQNGEKKGARVLVRHPRVPGSKLWEPPQGTEELAGENAALVPVDVPEFGKARLTVEERRPVRLTADFRSIEARNAIRGYLKSQSVQSSQRGALEGILKHAAQLATLDDQERRLTREQRELERSTDETRSSLKAIQKNNQAESLRRELTERLARGTRRLDEITKELIELRLRRTEQEVRLKEVILGLEIPPPDRRSANPSPE